MATHYEEEAEVAALKQWWRENWVALAAGLIIGLGAILGWQGWQRYQERQAAQAAQIFDDLGKAYAAGRADEAQKLGEALIKDFSSTPYAAAAALRLAAAAVEAARLDDAAARLAWVAQHSTDEGLRQLAQLRQARVLWAQGKNEEALKLLDAKAGVYAALYAELRGDILLAGGDRPAAHQAYSKALETAAEDDRAVRESLRRKLDDLTDVAQS